MEIKKWLLLILYSHLLIPGTIAFFCQNVLAISQGPVKELSKSILKYLYKSFKFKNKWNIWKG